VIGRNACPDFRIIPARARRTILTDRSRSSGALENHFRQRSLGGLVRSGRRLADGSDDATSMTSAKMYGSLRLPHARRGANRVRGGVCKWHAPQRSPIELEDHDAGWSAGTSPRADTSVDRPSEREDSQCRAQAGVAKKKPHPTRRRSAARPSHSPRRSTPATPRPSPHFKRPPPAWLT
jgi:hypothetical protein